MLKNKILYGRRFRRYLDELMSGKYRKRLLTKICNPPAGFTTKDDYIGKRRPSRLRYPILIKTSTAGTTGKSLTLWRTVDSCILERAFIARQWLWGGYTIGEPWVWLRGDMPVPAEQKQPPYWKYKKETNQLMMSSYHLSDDNIPAYLRILREFKPALIEAYPSAIYTIAEFCLRNDEKIHIPLIVTSSETLLGFQRGVIERAFGCLLLDRYGNAERTNLIQQCRFGTYHVIEEYSDTLIQGTGSEYGEIVGTSFNNRAQPFTRYRTGDFAYKFQKSCTCRCGFEGSFEIGEIVGRLEDMVITPDGRKIGRLDHVFKGIEGIRKAQITQIGKDMITVNLVSATTPDKGITDEVVRNLKARIGDTMKIKIGFCDDIPNEPGGKFRMVKDCIQ